MTITKKIGLAALVLAAALSAYGCGNEKAASESGKLKIGVVQIVQHGSLDAANQGFVDRLKERGYDDSKIELDQQNAQGDQSNLKSIASRFKQEKLSLICAIATPAAQAVANEVRDVPIVGTAITDYVTARLAKSNDRPGGNVTGVSNLASVDAQMDLGLSLVPNAKSVGLIYCSSEVNSEVQANMVKQYANAKGLHVEERTVNNVNDIQQVAESLSGACDLIYVPTDNTMASAVPTLIKVTNQAGIPVIAGAESMVKDGCLASLSVDYYKLGQQTGDLAADILDGKVKPEDAPIQYQKEYRTVINQKEAEALHISLPETISKNASLV